MSAPDHPTECATASPAAYSLDDQPYLHYLAETHPDLRLDESRVGVPSFFSELDIREPLLPGTIRALLSTIKILTPSLVTPRTLFLGSPFERYEQTGLLDQVSDPSDLARRTEEIATQSEASLVVATNINPQHPKYSEWLRAGFNPLPSFPDTVIELGVSSFEAHLSTIPPEDRSSVRRNIRKFERAGMSLEKLKPDRDQMDNLYRSYRTFFDRARVKWIPHTQEYFGRLGDLGERISLTVARASDGALAGFALNFRDRDTWHAGRLGILPQWDRRDAIYFRLFYHLIEEAIANNANRVILEPTCYRFKRHLGAYYLPLVNLVYGVSPVWKMMLHRLRPMAERVLHHLNEPKQLEKYY